VPCWLDSSQPDPDAAAVFYGGLFGWEFENRTPDGSPMRYLVGRLQGGDVAGIGSQPEGADGPAVWNTYVWVDSADETAAKVAEAGGSVLMDPFDISDAGRMAAFADPAGAAFCVWQAETGRGAQIVNEPGSWNFSGLNTPDPWGAKEFYGAVFGWETTDQPDSASFFRLPAYGDHLEERDPGLRERMKEVGAPDRFEETVAWLDTAEGGAPAQWAVTFAVDDADATAERATELGGEVLVPPLDAPWVRMTVLRDPQGATFTASKFVPPTY
jgi:predicted enzyme related to lactoylglutathione lyase